MRFLVGDGINVGEGGASRFQEESALKLHIQDAPRPRLVSLFIWLVLICILYDQTTIVKHATFLRVHTLGGGGNPWICSQLVRSVGSPGTPELVANIWSESSLINNSALDR